MTRPTLASTTSVPFATYDSPESWATMSSLSSPTLRSSLALVGNRIDDKFCTLSQREKQVSFASDESRSIMSNFSSPTRRSSLSSTGSSLAEKFYPHSPRERRVSFASSVCFQRRESARVNKSTCHHKLLDELSLEEIDLGTCMLIPRAPFYEKEDASIQNAPDQGKTTKRKTHGKTADASLSLLALGKRISKLRRKVVSATRLIRLGKRIEEETRKQNARIRQQVLRRVMLEDALRLIQPRKRMEEEMRIQNDRIRQEQVLEDEHFYAGATKRSKNARLQR